jgi:hypothetical protein
MQPNLAPGGAYAQFFCGETYFQHALPPDRSSMTRWRQRIGPERLELLLAESVAAAQRGDAVEDKHLRERPEARRKVFLILDRLRVHRARLTRDWLT